MRHSTLAFGAAKRSPVVVAAFVLLGCAAEGPPSPPAGEAVTIPEAFLTAQDTLDNIDSPAVWHGPGGEAWVLSTAKSTDAILVHDAATGALLRRYGATGDEPGQLRYPNGIAVMEDMLFVVERDNRRVQVFALPGFEPLGSFGADTLARPYGIALVARGRGADVYVTDQDEREDIPRMVIFQSRVKHFRITIGRDGIRAELVRTFGEPFGPGVLNKVESILADPDHGRLLIADEAADDLKIYTLDGRYTGTRVGGLFHGDAEGIALYRCGAAGYWIATDQGPERNVFYLYDRRTFEPLGSFQGPTTRNTDGVTVTQAPVGPMRNGAFYAIHDDSGVAAFSWSDIAAALGLRADCAGATPRRGT